MKILFSRSALRPHVCVSAQRLWDQVYSELTWHHHQHIHSKVKQPQSGPNNCHVPRQKRTLLDFTSWMRTGSRQRDLQAPERGPALCRSAALVPTALEVHFTNKGAPQSWNGFKLPKPCRKKKTSPSLTVLELDGDPACSGDVASKSTCLQRERSRPCLLNEFTASTTTGCYNCFISF